MITMSHKRNRETMLNKQRTLKKKTKQQKMANKKMDNLTKPMNINNRNE
jgi:hypothetical protein